MDTNNSIQIKILKRGFLLSFLFAILLQSCTSNPLEKFKDQLTPEIANNKEVIKAFIYYQDKGDKQKMNALFFLLNNIDYHYAQYNVLSKKYDSILSPLEYGGEIPAIENKNGFVLQKLITMEKKYGEIKPALTKIRLDIDLLDSDFLIKNIDMAFKAWEESPWQKEISFSDFCETILPYRADKEPIHQWREKAYENFSWVINNDTIHRIKACSMINDSIGKVLSNMIEMKMYPTKLTYDNMYKIKVGVCEDETAFAVLAMRSIGLPVGIDYIPQWPWRSMGHSWNYLLLEDGSSTPFMGTESNPGEPHFKHEKKGKVYRKTFSKQDNSLAQIEKNHERIPKFFRSPYFKDVTHLYAKTHDVIIPIESSYNKEDNYIYLSVFNNQSWIPIDWSITNQNKATFKNIEGGIVYLPQYYKNERLIYNNQPFVLSENGEAKVLYPNYNKLQKITLSRKYPLLKRMDDYLKNMVGGRFELSNNPDFSESVTLKTINQKPEPYLKVVKNKVSNNRYRYIRYVSSAKDSGRCNLAVFKVFGLKKDIELSGKVIGSIGSYKGYGAEKEKAFDNDPSTFFDASEKDWGKAWVGLEFDTPKRISKIEYMPRNDTNTIFKGQEYELFYWDKGWRGTGKKIASDSEEITFENIPSEALYLLHNHSGGKEERIFTYTDGEIRWY